MYFNDEEIVDYIPNAEEMKKRVSPLYIINDYIQTPETFEKFSEKFYTLIKGCIEHKECREYPIKFKFYLTDNDTHILELRHFIVNLFLWHPFSLLNGMKILNKSFIMDCKNEMNAKGLPNYINTKIITVLRDYHVGGKIINSAVSDVLHRLMRIPIDFSLIMGLSMDTEIFIELYQKNNRFAELMMTKIPDDMQPHDAEIMIAQLTDEEVQILKGEKNNTLGIILRAGTGVKIKQMGEVLCNGGYKPTLSGETIALAINSNTMIGGLQKVSALAIDAKAARKSLDKLLAIKNYLNCGELLVA